jgi:hypothetical protein
LATREQFDDMLDEHLRLGGSIDTEVYALNDAGQAAGYYFDAGHGALGAHGFVRNADGSFTTFDFPGSINTEVHALNDAGEAAGDYVGARFTIHGFVRDADGSFTTFDVPGSRDTLAGAGYTLHASSGGGLPDFDSDPFTISL